jgi:TRAP-type C4-dicarboxylate transport system substrate-binding protein
MNRFSLLPIGVAVIIAAAGCGGAKDSKTGAARDTPHRHATVLRLSSFLGEAGPMQPYADAVARASHGTLAIEEVPNVHRGDPDAERKLIADVQAGRTPLAVVGSRAWDTVGVRDFDALVAPFLITTYEQQRRVLEAPLASEMLGSLDRVHLTGLAVLPGPFRRMLGVRKTYRNAGDFRGTRVGIQRSRVAADTMRALGATPVALAGATRLVGIDGYEQQLGSIAGNGYAGGSRAVTTNLALWPRPLVVFANPRALARLTPTQRRALTEAWSSVMPATTAALADEDRQATAQLCRAGLKLELAPPAGLRSIEQAVQPVYRTLTADPATRRAVDAIRALRTHDAPPQRATCAGREDATGTKSAFDGVYRRSFSARQLAQHDGVPLAEVTPENYGDFVLVMDHGRFAFTQHNAKACTWQYGRMSVAGDRLEWDFTDGGGLAPTNAQNKPGERFVFKPQLYRGTLTLKAIVP